MRIDHAKARLRVRVDSLARHPDAEMLVEPEYLQPRKEGATGTLLRPIERHQGIAWWVVHDPVYGGETAAYTIHELKELEDQTAPEEPLGSPIHE